MLTKIHDDLYIDLERLECISKNEEGKYYLALQNRAPTRITYEHFKTLQEIIDKQKAIVKEARMEMKVSSCPHPYDPNYNYLAGGNLTGTAECR